MWYVYILKSVHYKKSYVGSTNNLTRRLNEHNSGYSGFTKRYKPWILLKSEEYPTYIEARRKEKFYKTGYGRTKLKEIFSQHCGIV